MGKIKNWEKINLDKNKKSGQNWNLGQKLKIGAKLKIRTN